jgi:hypothetical protein
MSAYPRLESLARRYLPPAAARLAKRVMVGPRARKQAAACRAGFEEYGDRYPNPVLFIAGLPKSGTTWLERMISSYPGYHDYLIPDVAAHELRTGGSHDYDLPADMFGRFDRMLVLTKMHVHGSPHNARLLHEAGIPYAVLHRDLRDVAVSNHFYVRNTPWHPEHRFHVGRSLEEGLRVFADRTLPAYVDWVRSWRDNHDPARGIILRYEDLLADTADCMTRLARHFGLDDDPAMIADIVERNSFRRLSEGRDRGQSSDASFFRKGVAGDWRNHFTPALTELYRDRIGAFLVEIGDEEDGSW